MSFLSHDHAGVVYHTSSVMEGNGIIHGFSTRLGGVSKGAFESLNLRSGGRIPITGSWSGRTTAASAPPWGWIRRDWCSPSRSTRTRSGT